MNPKLKISLTRRISEGGFALPIAIGLGFVLLLIAATLIMRSQGDRVTASAQKATNRGLSAAETGITRYQSLINDNRPIATYRDCVGTRNASGTCPDSGNTISWANATKIPGITSCSSVGNATNVVSNSTTAWQDVDAGDTSKGQYRLVSYVYPAPGTTGTTGVVPGIGQLTVEGRVNQSGSGNTATQGASTATSRLQINIPVQEGDLSSYPVPGLWLKTGKMPGNQTTKGNILLNDCSISPAPTSTTNQELDNSQTPARPYTDPATDLPYQTKQVSINFPTLPSKPSPFVTSPNDQRLGDISSDITLPRTGDKSNTGVSYPTANKQYPQPSTGVFEYSISSVTGNNKITIRNTPGIKVKFYLDGNIAKQAEFHHDCTSSGCEPTDFQIFGYGTSSNTICLNGNGLIDAFIFAPTYSAGVDGNGQFRGSIWVNDFNASSCSSASNHLVVLQLASWKSLGLTPQGVPPTVGSISTWQRQERQ